MKLEKIFSGSVFVSEFFPMFIKKSLGNEKKKPNIYFFKKKEFSSKIK